MLERIPASETRIKGSTLSTQPGEQGNLAVAERRQRLVVAGFGMVAYKLVERLAALGALGGYAVIIIGEEPYPAFDRVHLTGWLDHRDWQRLVLGRPGWSQALGIRVITGNPVASIDRENRTVYARRVVHRLQDEEQVIRASEHWQDDKALPLPAQMFRMGAEMVAKKTDKFSYSLLSKWPVNKKNAPRTEVEIAGLDRVAKDPSKPFYGRESLGGVEYFTAVYPDLAVSPACVTCHNAHKDSPRNDFELGDTMGGVVIRIPLS